MYGYLFIFFNFKPYYNHGGKTQNMLLKLKSLKS